MTREQMQELAKIENEDWDKLSMEEIRQKIADTRNKKVMETPIELGGALELPREYEPGVFEKMAMALNDPDNEAYKAKSRRLDVNKDWQGFGEPVESDDTPGKMTGMEHIRQLILSDFPQAGSATDEELEKLYDQWAAQHGE